MEALKDARTEQDAPTSTRPAPGVVYMRERPLNGRIITHGQIEVPPWIWGAPNVSLELHVAYGEYLWPPVAGGYERSSRDVTYDRKRGLVRFRVVDVVEE